MKLIHPEPVHLSHWNASIPIAIRASIAEDLKRHHVIGIRFLYDCFRRNENGAILNQEKDMNFPIQISAFFNAISYLVDSSTPLLVICSELTVSRWHYHLVNHGKFKVTVLSATNVDDVLQRKHDVILAKLDTKMLRSIKELNFISVVIEDIDVVVTKQIVKQIKGQFYIGLTTYNFLKERNQKIFYAILKWANVSVLKRMKYEAFCVEDTQHTLKKRDPYAKCWQRLTWDFCETFVKPSEDDEKAYTKKINDWCHNRTPLEQDETPKRETRKRKTVKASKELHLNPSTSKQHSKKYKATRSDLPLDVKSDEPLFDNDDVKTELNDSLSLKKKSNDSPQMNDSQETIIDEDPDVQNSPSHSDDGSVLTSIMEGKPNRATDYDFETNNFIISTDNDDNILTQIIKTESSTSQSSNKKGILSMLYGDTD